VGFSYIVIDDLLIMVVRLVCCSPCMHLPLWNMGDDFFIERVELVAWWLGLTAATQPTQVQTPRGEVCGVTQKNYLACLISKYMSKVSSDHSLMSYGVTV
jgi:hypothetical protein